MGVGVTVPVGVGVGVGVMVPVGVGVGVSVGIGVGVSVGVGVTAEVPDEAITTLMPPLLNWMTEFDFFPPSQALQMTASV